MPARALDAGSQLALAPEYEGWIEQPPRWLSHAMPGFQLRVHERPSGRILGAIDGADSRDVSTSLGVVTGYRGGKPAVLRLSDGRVSIPEPVSTSGQPAAPQLVLVPRNGGDVVVTARARDGSTWYGFWDSLEGPKVTLTHRSPRDGKWAEWNAASAVWELFGGTDKPEDPTCPRVRLGREGPRCIGRDVGASLLPVWVGDWVARDEGLVHATSGARVAVSRPGAHVIGALREPTRALYAWQDPAEPVRHMELLAPDGTMGRFSVPSPPGKMNGFTSAAGLPENALLAEQAFLERGQRTSRYWIDLERGTVFLTEPLEAIEQYTSRRRTLAVRRGTDQDTLVLLDFDRRKVEALGAMPHCEGRYWPGIARGDLLGFACVLQPNPRVLRLRRQWSEVVDLASRLRLRPRAPWAAIDVLPDGRLLLASRDERPLGPLRAVPIPTP